MAAQVGTPQQAQAGSEGQIWNINGSGIIVISGGDGKTYSPSSFQSAFGYNPVTGGSAGGGSGSTLKPPPGNVQAGPGVPGTITMGNNPPASGGGGTSSGAVGSSASPGQGDIQLTEGWGYELIQMEYAYNENLTNIEATYNKELANINNQAAMDRQREANALQQKLTQAEIDSNEYLARLQIQQRESEFARSLAQQQLEFQKDYELRRVAEIRQERLLQAELAASPADWVAYQYYARQLGTPEAMATADAVEAAGLTGGQGGGSGSGGPPTGQVQGAAGGQPQNLLGEDYVAAAPAYTDQTLQGVVNSIFGQQNGEYNPNLRGQGAFGTQIQSPNSVSREQAANFSDTDIQMLSSLLKGGINVGGGKMASVNPKDYFQQMQKSFVPTLGEAVNAGTNTQYQF